MWEAYASKVGVEVVCSDIEVFKRRFYAERNKAREEGCFDFDNLQVISPPPDVTGRIWIVKKDSHEKTH